MVLVDTLYTDKNVVNCLGQKDDSSVFVGTDTRKLGPNDAYIALKGERYDGFSFLETALERGAKICVYTFNEKNYEHVQNLSDKNPKALFLGVKNTLDFLQSVAKEHVRLLGINGRLKYIIGLTGSNGKTTTKEMLNHFLASTGLPIRKTEGNLNNHIGVPLTLLSINPSHEIAIVEMGTSSPGEIRQLCKMAQPNVGIITNIGRAHLEFFLTQDGIFKEKRALFDSVMQVTNDAGLFISYAEDAFLQKLPDKRNHLRLACSNLESKYYMEFFKDKVIVHIDDLDFCLQNTNITGKHNYINLALAFLLASTLYPDFASRMQHAASDFVPTSNRSQWVEKWGKHIFLDAYNANPDSMKSSIEGFLSKVMEDGDSLANCLFVLGDMNELGSMASALHSDIGSFLNQHAVENPVFLGKYSSDYSSGYTRPCFIYSSVQEFSEFWKKAITNRKYVFIKGSRSLQLERLLDIK